MKNQDKYWVIPVAEIIRNYGRIRKSETLVRNSSRNLKLQPKSENQAETT
jgi:hypothetical protein